MESLREQLVAVALAWEQAFGNAPPITGAVAEYDAAQLLGCPLDAYSACMQGSTAVQKGHDFVFNGARYQVKGRRPSGKPGSPVTLVFMRKSLEIPWNLEWDYLIWILYDSQYRIQEAWQWDVASFTEAFRAVNRLSPAHLRGGKRLA